MDLVELEFPVCWDTPPAEILRTIEIAERLHGQMKSDEHQKRIPLLVNSNYYIAYHALKHVRDMCVDRGLGGDLSFCEWGSGLGVVTCIASQLGFRATGIEIEESLCELSRALAKKVNVQAKFFQTSYRDGLESNVEESLYFPVLGGLQKCEVIYAYPWPAEERFIESLFQRVSTSSSLLITYHGGTTLRVKKPRMSEPESDLHRLT